MSNTKEYEYSEKLEPSQFRLLHVNGSSQTALEGELEIFPLDDAPSYKALSYVWGPPQHVDRISVSSNASLPVGANLQAALRVCILHHVDFIWIDAICINQADLKEREQQVQIMRQIYGQAEEVLIWLDEEDDISAVALHSAIRIGQYLDLPFVGHTNVSEAAIQAGIKVLEKQVEEDDRLRKLAWDDEDITPDQIEGGLTVTQVREIGVRSRQQDKYRAINLANDLDPNISEDDIDQFARALNVISTAKYLPTPTTEMFEENYGDMFRAIGVRAPVHITWNAMCTVYAKSWFKRVWIIQELALAKKATCLIGSNKISWEMLIGVDDFYSEQGLMGSMGGRSSHQANQLDIIRINRANQRPADLLSLLAVSKEANCTNPRDFIYSILGLTDHEHIINFPPRYDISIPEAYSLFTKYVVRTFHNLDILSFVDKLPNQSTDLPSWALDLRQPRNGTRLTEYGKNNGFNANGNLPISHDISPPQIPQNHLLLRGRTIATIAHTSVSLLASPHGDWKRPSRPRVDPYIQTRRYHRAMLVFRAWMSFAKQFLPDPYEPTNEEPITVFWRTLVSNMLVSGKPLTPNHAYDAERQILTEKSTFPCSSSRKSETPFYPQTFFPSAQKILWDMIGGAPTRQVNWDSEPSFWMYAMQICLGKRIFVTSILPSPSQPCSNDTYNNDENTDPQRLFGLGPAALKSGDIVVVFTGGCTPFILRKAIDSHDNENKQGNKYILIGPAYIRGLMNGQAFKIRKGNGTKAKDADLNNEDEKNRAMMMMMDEFELV
ncbi:putative heterokaryon incompatibility protein [Phaeomoniella chlamydospora]|uniref:Putative heterokaryon incompatibility protein n=1 Tax=Phaeomoniella chlamydospora TaxID=158046 RepID=A0A0G2GFZ2_PHACM|nr:putative heterokaryon incompatibility protein [Phaeomoniella chlamydospora]